MALADKEFNPDRLGEEREAFFAELAKRLKDTANRVSDGQEK